MSKKKPLEPLTKAKLLIQGEYLVISLIFLVCGILKIVGVMNSSPVRAHIFNFITLAGAIYVIFDFIWSTVSKKRREKVTYLDKVLALPLGIYLLIYDTTSIIVWNNVDEWYRYGISVAFFYIFLNYSFQAVYHWFFPTKALLAAVEADNAVEEEKESSDENSSSLKEENKESSSSEVSDNDLSMSEGDDIGGEGNE